MHPRDSCADGAAGPADHAIGSSEADRKAAPLDEPTTGLRLADVENLPGPLDRLVNAGKSAIVIEHHQAVMAHADWIIDLGRGAGHDGGRTVFEGVPGRPGGGAFHAHGERLGRVCRQRCGITDGGRGKLITESPRLRLNIDS